MSRAIHLGQRSGLRSDPARVAGFGARTRLLIWAAPMALMTCASSSMAKITNKRVDILAPSWGGETERSNLDDGG